MVQARCLFHDIDLDGDQDLFWGDFFEAGLAHSLKTQVHPKYPCFRQKLFNFQPLIH